MRCYNASIGAEIAQLVEPRARDRVRIQAEAAGEFSYPDLNFCVDSYSVSVPFPYYRSGT